MSGDRTLGRFESELLPSKEGPSFYALHDPFRSDYLHLRFLEFDDFRGRELRSYYMGPRGEEAIKLD